MNRRTLNNYGGFPLRSVISGKPDAVSYITGNKYYQNISGFVFLYQTNSGVVVWSEIRGLPHGTNVCNDRIFGFHIHEGGTCEGTTTDPFSLSGPHYNPQDCDHPYHAGDLPPLFGNKGLALSVFLTNRFTVNDVIGRIFIIHDSPDDFTSQPSGNSGSKIACGVIIKTDWRRKRF